MAETDIPDETLVAFADGELDQETARRVAEAAESDPGVAARIALFRGTGDALSDLTRARRTEPVPPALEARVRETLARSREGATVLPFAPSNAAAPRQRYLAGPPAIAAGIALALGLGVGWLIAPDSGGDGATGTGLSSADGVAPALEQLDSGESAFIDAGEITVVSSFRDASGAFCREYEIEAEGSGLVAIACHEDGTWAPRFAAVTGAPDGTYAPASSLEALDAFLTGIGASEPLDAEAEAEALANLVR